MSHFEKLLASLLLDQPQNTKINSKIFMHEAFEIALKSKKFSGTALKMVHDSFVQQAENPCLIGKLFKRAGKDYTHPPIRNAQRNRKSL